MISVIVPVYNTAKYLDQCIASILGQTCSDLELLLVDDGSSDGSSDALDRWAEKDPRIRVFHKESNTGVSDSRNIGLRLAKGEYVAFVDSDDWLEPEMYEQLLKRIEAADADVAIGGYCRITRNGNLSIYPDGQDGEVLPIKQALLRCMPQRGAGRYNLFLVTKLFTREVLQREEKAILFDTRYSYCEDVLWLVQVMLNCKKAVLWRGCGYNYRTTREGNTWQAMSRYSDLKKCDSAMETNRQVYRLLENESGRLRNNALQRLLFYQRYGFRTADYLNDHAAYRRYRAGYYPQLLRWYFRNRTWVGFHWLIRQIAADRLFLCKRRIRAVKRRLTQANDQGN